MRKLLIVNVLTIPPPKSQPNILGFYKNTHRHFYLLLIFIFCLLFSNIGIAQELPLNPEEKLAPDAPFSELEIDDLSRKGFIFEHEHEAYDDTTSVILALTAGLFIHGAGHLYAGDTTTGLSLLGVEALSLALLGGAGIAYLQDTENAAFYAPVFQTGFGLFIFSYLADVAGSIAGPYPALPSQNHPQHSLYFSLLYNLTNSRGSPVRHALDAQLELEQGNVNLKMGTVQDLFLKTAMYTGEGSIKTPIGTGSTFVALGVDGQYINHSGRGPFSRTSLDGTVIGQFDLGDFFSQLRGFSVGLEIGYGYSWWGFANADNVFKVQNTKYFIPFDVYTILQLNPQLQIKGGYGYARNPFVASIAPLLGVIHLETIFETSDVLKLRFELDIGDGFSGALGASLAIF